MRPPTVERSVRSPPGVEARPRRLLPSGGRDPDARRIDPPRALRPLLAAGVTAAMLLTGGLGASCHPSLPCTSTGRCSREDSCQPSGRCAPSADEARLSGSRRIWASDWAGSRTDHASRIARDIDTMALGGPRGGSIYLLFGPFRADERIVGARLFLHPAEGWSGPTDSGRIVIHATLPFDGARLTAQNAPGPIGSPVGVMSVEAGTTRLLVADVSEAISSARRLGRRRIALLLRRFGPDRGAPWRIASPRCPDHSLRPSLLLLSR